MLLGALGEMEIVVTVQVKQQFNIEEQFLMNLNAYGGCT